MATNLSAFTRERWHALSKLGSEAVWVVLGQLLSLAGTLIGVRILTEYLSPSAYGELGLSLTISALFSEVVIGGLVGAFTRFYSIAVTAGDVPGYVRGVKRLLLCAASVAVLLLAVVSTVSAIGFEGLSGQSGVAVTVFAVLFGTNAALNAVFNGARRRRLVALNSAVDAWLKICLAVLAIHLFGPNPLAVLAAYALSLILILCNQFYRLHRLSREQEVTSQQSRPRLWGKEMLLFAAPASAWGVFTWAQQVADRWALQTFYSAADVGLYSVVLQIGYFPMVLLMGMLGTFLTPIFFQKTDDQAKQISQEQNAWWHLVLLVGAAFSVAAAAVAFLLKDRLFTLLVSEEYWSVSKYLPVMVLAGGLFGAGNLMAVRLISHMRMVQLAKVMIGTALVGIVLIFALTSVFGLPGTVFAKLMFALSYISWMVWVTVFYKRA